MQAAQQQINLSDPEANPKTAERKRQFIDIYNTKITRDGAANLLMWLESDTDFFTAPASTRFHLSEEGGLCQHSLNVYRRLNASAKALPDCSEETLAIVSLLHDVCKTNFYTVEERNAKDASGKWVKVPYYAVEDKFPLGHGEKSLFLIHSFIALTHDEALAIRHHMGGFGASPGDYSIGNAFTMSRLALELHIADMRATHVDEKEQ